MTQWHPNLKKRTRHYQLIFGLIGAATELTRLCQTGANQRPVARKVMRSI